MPNARLANVDDLGALLVLFAASDVSRSVEPRARAEQIWAETLAREGVAVFVSDADSRIVSTCMLITTPNLLRGGRQFGILENVATHPDFQGRGLGARLTLAVAAGILERGELPFLHASADNARAIRLYERLGFHPSH